MLNGEEAQAIERALQEILEAGRHDPAFVEGTDAAGNPIAIQQPGVYAARDDRFSFSLLALTWGDGRIAASLEADDRSVSGFARIERLPAATLRSWVLGRQYPTADGSSRFAPLIQPASLEPPLLSFWNLIEAHVVRSLRTEHGVSVKALRDALQYAETRLGIDRLLLRPELRTEAGNVFLERYGELIHLSNSGQLAMSRLFKEHLKRVEWDASRFPVRLYPFVVSGPIADARSIVIDPQLAFGRPVSPARCRKSSRPPV